MDSCNSTGSMDSSSGADDDEYTSRPVAAVTAPAAATSIFSFMMNSSNHLPFLHNHDKLPPPLPVFEALPNSFDQVVRPGPTDRNNHNHHQDQLFQLGSVVGGDELGAMLPLTSLSGNSTTALQVPGDLGYRLGQSQTSDVLTGGVPNLAVPPVSDPPKLPEERPERGNNNGAPPARRNPKKRTRASRRAPTTVLTTDTNNFRAMVQEFTGIPAPPFAAVSSQFQRARLDLFGTNFASGSSSLPSPSYLLRPFAQRLFEAAPPPTTLFVPATISNNNAAISTSTELFFPLLGNNNNNINGTPNATTASTSMLDFGQVLLKYSSDDHNRERGEQDQHRHSQGNLGPGGANDVLEEFGLSRQGSRDRDRDRGSFVVASSSSSQNVAIANRSEGMAMESWICSSD